MGVSVRCYIAQTGAQTQDERNLRKSYCGQRAVIPSRVSANHYRLQCPATLLVIRCKVLVQFTASVSPTVCMFVEDVHGNEIIAQVPHLWHGPAAGAVSSIASRVLTCKDVPVQQSWPQEDVSYWA